MFLFNALKFVDHVPSRLKCCNDNASMKNLNSLFFFFCSLMSRVDVINKNTQTDVRNQLCTTRRTLVCCRRRRPPTQCTAFIMTQQNQTEWCSRTLFSLFVKKEKTKKKKSVKNILWHFFIFHQVLNVFFAFVFFCVVYWNNTALCQK